MVIFSFLENKSEKTVLTGLLARDHFKTFISARMSLRRSPFFFL